jgi:hypothetical protein
MSNPRAPSIVPPNRSYPRAELEEMIERWLAATVAAEKDGDWTKHLGAMYKPDAVYSWNTGPNEEFVANGRQEICDIALGYQMKGFEGWEYPYHDLVIDEKRGTVIGLWHQISPFKRKDGSYYCVEGICGSWFEYGGDFQWQWQRDFFDLGNAKDCFFQLAGAGHLNPVVKEKIHRQSKGGLLPGHRKIRPDLTAMEKMRDVFAIVKIALTGR